MKLVPVAFVLVALLRTDLIAATLSVANNGVDSNTCGAQGSPCRSITQAMVNAVAGDTILVGPGRYGDLTEGETNFTFPGEEMPPGGSQYLIVVDKLLTIESTHGADVTRVSAGGAFGGVQITLDGVVFGGPGRGFSFVDLADNPVFVTAGTTGVSVGGITADGNEFVIEGTGHTLSHNIASSVFTLRGTGHTFKNNLVTGGVRVGGADHSITDNLFITAGLSINEEGDGATGIEVRGNSFIGAGLGTPGISIGLGATATITENNIFGNWPPVYPPEGNCGLSNGSGGNIDATNNFWGASTGPGPDPADDVCNVPDTGSITLVEPFATEPFAIASESPGGGGANGSPTCSSAHPYPNVLWPPNHQFVAAWIIGVGDPDNDPVAISITGVTQDEPLEGLGDGDVAPDAVVHGSSVDIRAERSGSGNGRVYRVEFTASDGKGGSCTGAVTIGVPNNQKPGQAIVDDGQSVNSTQF